MNTKAHIVWLCISHSPIHARGFFIGSTKRFMTPIAFFPRKVENAGLHCYPSTRKEVLPGSTASEDSSGLMFFHDGLKYPKLHGKCWHPSFYMKCCYLWMEDLHIRWRRRTELPWSSEVRKINRILFDFPLYLWRKSIFLLYRVIIRCFTPNQVLVTYELRIHTKFRIDGKLHSEADGDLVVGTSNGISR